MKAVLDLDRYPLDDLVGRWAGKRGEALVQTCRRELADGGMFSLAGFVRRQALEACVGEIRSVLDGAAFIHRLRGYADTPNRLFSATFYLRVPRGCCPI